MSENIIVGAGPTGTSTARLLAEAGETVRIVARTPSASGIDGVERIALDATDGNALAAASRGAKTFFMCAMAPYDRWPADFPPILDGVIHAARQAGARLVIVGNLYGYGENAPSTLRASLPLEPTSVKGRLRVALWTRALASGVPTTEVRGSDYLGRGAASAFTLLAAKRLVAGEIARFPADLDAVHPWTFTEDVARTLVAAARSDASWGRAFHVPSQHASVRQVATRLCELAGAPAPRLARMARAELEELGSIVREIAEVAYLAEKPWTLDASDTERVLDVRASSLDTMLRATLVSVV